MKSKLYSEIKNCRICGSSELKEVLSLGNQALTGVFPKKKDDLVQSGPVDLVSCVAKSGCGLVQLKQSYSTDLMYGENYGYRSGLNSSMVKHLNMKISKIEECLTLKDGDVVIDIGSNDATSLHAYSTKNLNRIGIDPSAEKFLEFYTGDMKLIVDFFNFDTIRETLNKKKAKVITSFSMYYDLEDPVSFARAVKYALNDDGIWVLEQSYLGSMLSTNSFDTVCHEHLEFYGLSQINYITKKVGLKIIDVEFNKINGGSFSITVAHEENRSFVESARVKETLKEESALQLNSEAVFEEFRKRINLAKIEVLKFLTEAKNSGKTVYGLGASTKGNVILQYFNIDVDLLPKIAEVNPDKFGSYTPGTKIPIISEEQALRESPDYFLVLPWHFKDFFLNNAVFERQNLVFPLPKLCVVNRSAV